MKDFKGNPALNFITPTADRHQGSTAGDPRVYTLADVSRVLHVTPRTLRDYIKAGELRAAQIGRRWIVTGEDLDAFISTGTTPGYRERLRQGKKTRLTSVN